MQSQPDLIDLGRARLFLFERFCLPTVLGQTVLRRRPSDGDGPDLDPADFGENGTVLWEEDRDPRILWIIKVDPDLHPSLLLDLVGLVRPYPNFYVVGSSVNFGVGIKSGGWRGGQAGDDVLSAADDGRVHAGDVNLLRRAHRFREERIVLETRLDADDGLNFLYLERTQLDAMAELGSGLLDERSMGLYRNLADPKNAEPERAEAGGVAVAVAAAPVSQT